MIHPFLIGPKLYLRPFEPEDARQLTPWVNDAKVARTMRFFRPMSLH
jgi:hypothetical protein